MAKARYRNPRGQTLEAAAGNGLIDRRALLGRGMVFAGAMSAGIGPSAAGAEPLADDPWSLEICSRARPPRMGCISPSITRASPTSIRISTGS
jgi:hypothetical protein